MRLNPPLSLACRIERIGHALTAEELAGILTVSKITIFETREGGTHPFVPNRYVCTVRPESRGELAPRDADAEGGLIPCPFMYSERS